MRPSSYVLLALIALPGTSSAGDARSVYQVDAKVDAPLIAASTLITSFLYLDADHLIRQRCPCSPNEVNGFDRHVIGNHNVFLDSLSDATAAAAVIVPVLGDALDLGLTREFWEDLVVFSETISVNGALVSGAKYSFQRPLPRTYAGDLNLIHSPGGYRSFYSGHASLTFSALSAASMTLDLRYHSGAWPWIVTGLVGTAVSFERVAAGRHFYTDVLIGSGMGAIVGVTVPWFHRKEAENGRSVAVIPLPGGAMVSWNARF